MHHFYTSADNVLKGLHWYYAKVPEEGVDADCTTPALLSPEQSILRVLYYSNSFTTLYHYTHKRRVCMRVCEKKQTKNNRIQNIGAKCKLALATDTLKREERAVALRVCVCA